VHFKETGHELIALLFELHEIKVNQPELNKSLRRNNYPYALYFNPNSPNEQPCLLILKNNNKNDARYLKYKQFGSKVSGDAFLQDFLLKHEICKRYAKTRNRTLSCYCQEECKSFFYNPVENIAEHLEEVKNEFENDFILLFNGREPKEKSFVMIHEKRFWGIGFIAEDTTILNREEWNDFINYQFFYPEANGIIKTYMAKNKVVKIDL
jgi:DNA polymerase-3 subunit epsilon